MSEVTVCIPAWQAAGFIDRTLECARAQTHAALRVVVSVDLGEDDTVARCRAHAALDPRIEVIAHEVRLGWSANTNAALARVATPYFFLYFHDDVIAPTYVAALLAALQADPDAASAHCDLERFGNLDGIDPGHDYVDEAPRRFLDFLVGPVRGTLLRSLCRSDRLAHLRFPQIGDDGAWRTFPYVLDLLAAGRARHVAQPLYRRWHRDGSLTATWRARSRAALLTGQRAAAALCLAKIDALGPTPSQRAALVHALYLYLVAWTRREEFHLPGEPEIAPAEVADAFAHLSAAVPPGAIDAEVAEWIDAQRAQLAALEATNAARRAGMPR